MTRAVRVLTLFTGLTLATLAVVSNNHNIWQAFSMGVFGGWLISFSLFLPK